MISNDIFVLIEPRSCCLDFGGKCGVVVDRPGWHWPTTITGEKTPVRPTGSVAPLHRSLLLRTGTKLLTAYGAKMLENVQVSSNGSDVLPGARRQGKLLHYLCLSFLPGSDPHLVKFSINPLVGFVVLVQSKAGQMCSKQVLCFIQT